MLMADGIDERCAHPARTHVCHPRQLVCSLVANMNGSLPSQPLSIGKSAFVIGFSLIFFFSLNNHDLQHIFSSYKQYCNTIGTIIQDQFTRLSPFDIQLQSDVVAANVDKIVL